jgi:VWFA-related protein
MRLSFVCLITLTLTLVVCLPGSAQRKSNRLPPPPPRTGDTRGSLPSETHENANQESKIEFSSQSILVQVPTIVQDKNGQPVRGLTKQDFEVLEDNKPRNIAVFEETGFADVRITQAATAAGTFSNGLTASRKPNGVTVFLIDTINTPFLDQAYGRKELIHYLASSLDPGQSFALILMNSQGVKVLHDVTRDPAELVQALKKLNGELPAMQGTSANAQALALSSADGNLSPAYYRTAAIYNSLRDFALSGETNITTMQQSRAIEITMRSFLQISWALSGIPGRKSLIWATGSFPFYIDSAGAVPPGLSVLYERAMQAMSDSQIAIYPVDVRGLVGSGGANTGGAGVGPAATRQLLMRSWLNTSTLDTLRDVADMTGGRAFYNTNDLSTSFHRAAADSAHYYLLGYYLDSSNRNPGWRKLKVKLNRKDVEVRSRNGYFVTNATVRPELSRKLDIKFALDSPFSSTGVPLSVQWTGASPEDAKNGIPADKKKVNFMMRISGAGLAIETTENKRLNVDILAYAFLPNATEPVTGISQTVLTPVSEGDLPTLRQKGVGYHNALELAPGQYTVRFVVRDNVSGMIGSVSAPVTVN